MLLEKLLEIEKAVIEGDFTLVHSLEIEAEDYALRLERELMTFRENEKPRSSRPPAFKKSRG